MTAVGRSPILVTGLPRSGTTWLARLLAESPGTAMLGREPMNPRDGQWALGGQASSWTRWESAPATARRLLARTYRGRAPRSYGRLGIRQWRAPLPGTRVVVKDPFALLSLPAVVEATGAVPVVLYRSPDSVLASYRRMGWRADVEEFRALGAPMPADADTDDVVAMAVFWAWAHSTVLDDLESLPHAVLVSHAELTAGGDAARRTLCERLDLDVPAARRVPVPRGTSTERVQEERLHNFDRSPDEVLAATRHRVDDDERMVLEARTADVAARIAARRLVVA